MKRTVVQAWAVVLVMLLAMSACAGSGVRADAEPVRETGGEAGASDEAYSEEPEPDGTPVPVTAYIVVHGFEFGPGVNKVVLELDEAVDAVCADAPVSVVTSHWTRAVTGTFLSDRMGYPADAPSRYVTFDLATSFECTGSPFENDAEDTEHNIWADSYIVTVSVTVEENGQRFALEHREDCIGNHFSPDVVAFNTKGTFSGEYENVLRGETEELTLNYAAYEPASLAGGEKDPLVIWLHGRGEGGGDIEITLLGNEVSALTEAEIQSHFTAGDETGAYVLVPQSPTYWMDAGDGTEHGGDMPSRYQNVLMDLIAGYVAGNDDVDPARVYLVGASNGGYMALELLEKYPDFFAAAVSCSPAYSYSIYARDFDGSYRQFFGQRLETGDVYLTEEKLAVLKDKPIWIVSAATDTVMPVLEHTVPLYHALVSAGADNCWCSMYVDVYGEESTATRYLGHWAWIYLLNDQVCFVQDPERIAESDEYTFFYGFEPSRDGGTMRVPDKNGGAYDDLFDWLNDQTL